MITNDDTALLVLKDLILAGREAAQGYQLAADRVKLPELVQLFEDYALQRKKFLLELEERVRTLRGTPPSGSTTAGSLHRGWMGLKAAVESAEAHALLTECERGDSLSVKAYAAALSEPDVDAQTRQLIQQQYEQVQGAHDRVRQLRESATYAHQ